MTNETTFENVNLLDRVFNVGLGWGRVTDIYFVAFKGISHFTVQFASGKVNYLPSGVVSTGCGVAVNQTLFWDEVKIVAPVKPIPVPPKDTLVRVNNDRLRYTTGQSKNGEIETYDHGANSKTSNGIASYWKNWEVVE